MGNYIQAIHADAKHNNKCAHYSIILSEVQDRLIAIFEAKADKTKCQIYYHRTLICLSVTLGILLSLTKELHNNVLVTMPNSQNVAVILLFQQHFHLVMIFHRFLC